MLCGARVVTSQQNWSQPRLLHTRNRFGGNRFHRVRHHDDTARCTVAQHDDGSGSRGLGIVDGTAKPFVEFDVEMRRPADGDAARPDLPRHTDAVSGVELVYLWYRKILCSNDNGAADGMFRSLLHRRGEGGDLVCGDPCCGVHGVDAHLAGRHGAGLVQHDGVDASGLLEHLGARQQDSELRTTSGADHQRGRCRESERTGARDDQDRDRRGERRQYRTVDPPEDQCAKGNEHDGGNKDAGDPIGESLDLGLTRLRGLDHPGHLCQRGVGTDVGRTNHESTARIDRRADDVVVDGHLDGHGFACEHGHIDS